MSVNTYSYVHNSHLCEGLYVFVCALLVVLALIFVLKAVAAVAEVVAVTVVKAL